MAFAIYLHRDNFQPEAPLIVDKNATDSSVNFTFVDFVPSIIKRSSTVIPQCEVEYHSFSTIIDVANEWLQRNGTVWQVVNCETIILLYKYNDINSSYELRPHDCSFYVYGSEKNNVLKALRIWIRRRRPPEYSNDENGEENSGDSDNSNRTKSEILRYRDLKPQLKPEKSGAQQSQFEDIDDLLRGFNDEILTSGLDGRIVTIESLAYEATKDWKIDTETSLSYFSTKNIFILRVFYMQTTGDADDDEDRDRLRRTYDTIGIEDFAPKLIRRATFFKRPTFEAFDRVIERASAWLRAQTNFRFVNAQSIDIKMKSYNLVSSRQMAYTEHGDYMRIFRITYIISRKPQSKSPLPRLPPVILSTRLFLPYSKSDTIFDINHRLSEWINRYLEQYRLTTIENERHREMASGTILLDDIGGSSCKDGDRGGDRETLQYPRILSAETVEVFAKDFRNDSPRDIEKAAITDTFLANRIGNKNAYIFMSLRVFFDDSHLSASSSSMSASSSSSLSPDASSSVTIDSSHNTPNSAKKKARNLVLANAATRQLILSKSSGTQRTSSPTKS